MDKVVDHLLVFKGEGEIKDFPGNYTQFRNYQSLKSSEAAATENKNKEKKATTAKDYRNDTRRRMSYKEKREYEQLTADIEQLTEQVSTIEEQLCTGNMSIDELTEKSKLLPQLKEELDEKELRWLELSEME